MESTARKGWEQIDKKQYIDEFKYFGINEVIEVVIAFHEKNVYMEHRLQVIKYEAE